MKQRSDQTTSERQLVLALAAGGRIVSLDEIANWRKAGLLPPLASNGLGTGKGKTYYWRQENILQHAQATFDAMRSHGRADCAVVKLFLAGFCVPLPQLRRAWQNRVRTRKPPVLQIAAVRSGVQSPGEVESLLMQAAICMGAAINLDDAIECGAMVGLIEQLLPALGFTRPGINDIDLAAQLSHLLLVIASVLDAGALVRDATDEELDEAQHYLGAVTGYMAGLAACPAPAIDRIQPLLFVMLLTLLRSGQTEILDRVMPLFGSTAPPQASAVHESFDTMLSQPRGA